MKNLSKILAITFLAGIIALGTSCNNSGKKAENKTSDSLAMPSFNDQKNEFDSSWNDRMAMLDKRIHQWDSSAQTYRGHLKALMEKKVDQMKEQRDSLKAMLNRTGDQTEDKWSGFKQSVNAQYDSIISSMRSLMKANQ